MKRALAFAILALVIFSGSRASAERLITSLSSHQVLISSNFTGTELVLFGSIERDAATVPRRGGYSIVVTVTGPREGVATRRKARVLGIWTNVQSYTFELAPAYLAVLSNRPLDTVATPETLARLQLGLDNARLTGEKATPPPAAFRDALVRLRKERGLYREDPVAVTFLTPNLFRTSITIPAEAELGNYEVDVRLFADGANIASATSALEIVKVGIEQLVSSAARDHAFLYGLAITLMALLTGWFASVIFRRD